MSKTVVGYCYECNKKTKHKVVCCQESLGWRIFGGVFSLGLLTVDGYDYDCECTECGSINTIHK